MKLTKDYWLHKDKRGMLVVTPEETNKITSRTRIVCGELAHLIYGLEPERNFKNGDSIKVGLRVETYTE